MFFDDIQTISALRKKYLSLSVRYHPDRGGSNRVMQQINDEYRRRKQWLEQEQPGFDRLCEGDTVYVNGTECVVVSLTASTFIARAKGRERRAIFDKYSGRCLTDRKFTAQPATR